MARKFGESEAEWREREKIPDPSRPSESSVTPAPPEPVTPAVPKEPWVRGPLPSWARPLAPKPEPEKPISPISSKEEQMIYINLKQRVTVFVGLLLEAAMLLYPPWNVPDWASSYHLFSSPPSWTEWSTTWSETGYLPRTYQVVGGIDWQRLKIQCLIVGIITVGLVVLFGGKKSSTPPTH